MTYVIVFKADCWVTPARDSNSTFEGRQYEGSYTSSVRSRSQDQFLDRVEMMETSTPVSSLPQLLMLSMSSELQEFRKDLWNASHHLSILHGLF